MGNFDAPADGAAIVSAVTFRDINGFYHSLILTTVSAYYLDDDGYYLLTDPTATTVHTGLPFALALINERVYFSNGSKKIWYADGSQTLKVAGDVPGACRFMMVLGAHLLGGYWTEPEPGLSGSLEYPNRVRWSASGDANDWTSFGSGFTDLLEVPDVITGMCTLGRNGYVFHQNGIIIVYPTGDASAPFAFETYSNNIQAGSSGLGCAIPYTLATYGNTAGFVAHDDIYLFNGVELRAIGHSVKRRIFAEFSNPAITRAWMVPNMGRNYQCLSYWLFPGKTFPDFFGDVNTTWIYMLDEGTWQRATFLGGGPVTWVGNVMVS